MSDVWDTTGPSVPNSARMYDYYLGGKDNFPVDREAAEKAVAAMPAIPVLARANRAFLVDSVGKMAAAGSASSSTSAPGCRRRSGGCQAPRRSGRTSGRPRRSSPRRKWRS